MLFYIVKHVKCCPISPIVLQYSPQSYNKLINLAQPCFVIPSSKISCVIGKLFWQHAVVLSITDYDYFCCERPHTEPGIYRYDWLAVPNVYSVRPERMK